MIAYFELTFQLKNQNSFYINSIMLTKTLAKNRVVARKFAKNRAVARKFAENRVVARKFAKNRAVARKFAENWTSSF